VFTPVETIRRFKERLAEVDLEILKEVRRIDNGRLDIPIYFSITGKDAREVIGNKKQMGKGSTPEQSQASACMELGERFSPWQTRYGSRDRPAGCAPFVRDVL